METSPRSSPCFGIGSRSDAPRTQNKKPAATASVATIIAMDRLPGLKSPDRRDSWWGAGSVTAARILSLWAPLRRPADNR